jgi:hypothetical protein
MNEIKELREDIGTNSRQNVGGLNNNLGDSINFNPNRKVVTLKLNPENQNKNLMNKKSKEKKSNSEKLSGMDEE